MSASIEYASRIDRDGFVVVPDVIDSETVSRLQRSVEELGEREEVRRRGGAYGVRNLLEVLPAAVDIAADPRMRALVEPILGPGCFAVRGTLFDKIPGAN